MTKQIRIENADNSNHQVDVEVWEEREGLGSVLVKKTYLDHPTTLATETIYDGRYIVIREVKREPKP